MFDKEKRGKLTEAELREIMLQMGDSPISEDEFENFIAVIIKFLTDKATQELVFINVVFSVFQLTQKVYMTIKVTFPIYIITTIIQLL